MSDFGEIYENLNEKYDVNTAVYRFAVISKSLGVTAEEETEEVPLNIRTEILSSLMTAQKERALFLFAAGAITADDLHTLSHISQDICGVLGSAEDFLKEQIKQSEKSRMNREDFINALMCAAISYGYAKEKLSFEDGRTLAGLKCAKIVKGYVKISDEELFRTLAGYGEPFGNIDIKGQVYEQTPENIFKSESFKNGDISNDEYSFMLDPKRLIYYEKIYYKPFGKDFIGYAHEHNIPADEDILKRYSVYCAEIKCRFIISSYDRKRNICGDKINQFDYFVNVTGSSIATDHSETIMLSSQVEKSDDELILTALNEYCGRVPVQNDTVLEVRHAGKISLFVIRDGEYLKLKNEDFRKRLFDFDEIWGEITAFTADNPMKLTNGSLEIPVEFLRKFAEQDRGYAENLIREQFLRQRERRNGGGVIGKLDELISHAKETDEKNKALKEQQQELIDRKTAEFNAAKAGRGKPTEG